MNRLACTIALTAVVAAMLPASLPAQNTDPINGTWKLNLAKSKFNPGPARRVQPASTKCPAMTLS
jgi:hypothetical protein